MAENARSAAKRQWQRPHIRARGQGSEPVRAEFRENGWMIDLDFATVDGRFAAVDLRLRAIPGSGHVISRQAVEELHIADLLDTARAAITRLNLMTWQGQSHLQARRARAQASVIQATKPRVGRPRDDLHLQQVAHAYVRLWSSGVRRGLHGKLADIFTRDRGYEVPEETVRDWIRRARARGFLLAGTPGKAGAEPGPRFFEETP